MADISYIGSTLGVVAGVPGSYTQGGWAALVYTAVGKIVSLPGMGDSSEAIKINFLAGRVGYINGILDGGEMQIGMVYDGADAQQDLIRGWANGNTDVSIRIGDTDGTFIYATGRFANYKENDRVAGNYKGATVAFRVNQQLAIP